MKSSFPLTQNKVKRGLGFAPNSEPTTGAFKVIPGQEEKKGSKIHKHHVLNYNNVHRGSFCRQMSIVVNNSLGTNNALMCLKRLKV